MAWTTSARLRTPSTASINWRNLARIDPLEYASDPGQHSIHISPRVAAIGRLALQFALGRQMIVAIQAVVQVYEPDRFQAVCNGISLRPLGLSVDAGASR